MASFVILDLFSSPEKPLFRPLAGGSVPSSIERTVPSSADHPVIFSWLSEVISLSGAISPSSSSSISSTTGSSRVGSSSGHISSGSTSHSSSSSSFSTNPVSGSSSIGQSSTISSDTVSSD